MAVSTKIEYALRALLEVPARESVSAQAIAKRQSLPKKYLEHLLSALKNAGLITSSPGSRGGYTLARTADQISLWDIMEAVDDHSQVLDCEMDKQFCLGADCPFKPLFKELAAKQRQLFRKYSLASIARSMNKEIK